MRLTKDLGHGIYTVGDKLIDGYTMFGEPISKLGQLEDIEEKHNIKSTDDLDNRLTALEIIKEKDVDINAFKHWIIEKEWSYKDYVNEEDDPNTIGHQFAYKLLTENEFDLLKEVLS